ncbi:MAG: hypothetical protein ACR2F0_01215 [Chthoniobacterales bacterium]
MNDQPPELTELEIINGGVVITVVKTDGSQEQIKVRQLPIGDLPEYAQLHGDERALVELLAGKQDRSVVWKLRNARATEERFLALLANASFEQTAVLEKELVRVRGEIGGMESAERWADNLSEDSFVKILEEGERLNAKRFGRWAKRRREATGRMMKEVASPSENSLPQSA